MQFITPAGFYGAERWVLALANNLDTSRMVCDLAVTEESSGQDLSVANYYPESIGDVHRLTMSGRFDLRVVRQLVNVIRERRIEVILTHGYKSDILGFCAARMAGIRCVSTPHGFSGAVGFKLATFIRIGTMLLRYFDVVAPLSEELVSDMHRFRVPREKIRFIRNGVDLTEIDRELERSRENLKPSQRLAPEGQTIGFVGQLIPRKGIPDLIDVFGALYNNDKTLRLSLIGDGNMRSLLEEQAKALPGSAAIEFLGFRSDRLLLLADFDLFVMTSSLEGIPRCMMEAMALGVPVVAYDIPGVDQLVENGISGLLVPFGDKEGLQKACWTILNDSELAEKLAAGARNRVYEQYSAKRMADEYEALFRDLIQEATGDKNSERGGR
ncbi:MAG: glycosyltransferase family 4 protein [Sphingobacterium sp.]